MSRLLRSSDGIAQKTRGDKLLRQWGNVSGEEFEELSDEKLCGKFIVQAGMSTSVFHDREVYH
jgi:hypothetical protein